MQKTAARPVHRREIVLLLLFAAATAVADETYDINSVAPDLSTPAVTVGRPGPGKRVKQVNPEYADTDVYHALYLPVDWRPDKKYPVIVEYAGNKYKQGPGTVDACNLGYGISAGRGVIWVCLPFVDKANGRNATSWWGDLDATVEYCKTTVKRICEDHGGDPSAVFLAGFSRGSIACNFIGLHDDEIAKLWRGFICHSHYDGVRQWGYKGSDRQSAADRLKRLGDRPQFISHEKSVSETAAYLKEAYPDGNFRFQSLPFPNHTDKWVLRDIPERKALREWFKKALEDYSRAEARRRRGRQLGGSNS